MPDPAPEPSLVPEPAPDPVPLVGGKRGRPWPMNAVALLLLVQIAGLLVLLVLHLQTVTGLGLSELPMEEIAARALQVLSLTFAMLVLIAVSLFALAGNLRRWRNAWAHAMLAEGMTLLVGLLLYFNNRPPMTWYILAYGLFVVIYLILPGVQAAFLPAKEAAA